ncbi:MAG: hypothetical protein ACR2QQ_15885 [Gammaproteobacteria bacterium]
MNKIDLDQASRIIITLVTSSAIAAAFSLNLQPADAQESTPASTCPDNNPTEFHKCALEAAAFDPPRTADGRPDMAGIWLPPGGALEDLEEHPGGLDDNGGPTVVVDPPDGKVPMQAWADARRQENAQTYIHPSAACFMSGVPHTMYRPGSIQFLQTPDHFVIQSGRAHAYRIVYMRDHPPLEEEIRLWNGDSRGRWEGDTLVIETTNQNGKAWLDQRARFYTEEAHVIERLTLVDEDTLHYQATLNDPNVYTTAFTIAFPYRRNGDEGFEMMEEACYETNEALLEIYRSLGFTIYSGVSPEEAREAMQADERNP